MKKTVSIRLPEELADGITDIAETTERSKSFHIQKAVEMYLEDYADLQIALDRLRDKDDDLVSGEEIRREIGL